MIVFNTYLKVIKKYVGTIILYTMMLVIFGSVNYISNESENNYVSNKPNILIVNNDSYTGITKNLIDYMYDNSNKIEVINSEEEIDDALFYRNINYVIYIPKGYRSDVLRGKDVSINIKSNLNYDASLGEMLLTRYLRVQSIYLKYYTNEEDIIRNINNNLSYSSDINVVSKVDSESISKVSRFYNFASYSIMAVIIYIICLVISSFNKDTIKKRTIVSSMPYKRYNKYIFLSSLVYALSIWIIYIIIGIIMFGDVMLSLRGVIYIFNTLIYIITALSLSLLISNLVNSKGAISGIVNVVSLGQAFLCGAFIPFQYMDKNILKYSKILPAYYYNINNDLISTIEIIDINSIKDIIINDIILVCFIFIFIIINNIVSKRKRVIM